MWWKLGEIWRGKDPERQKEFNRLTNLGTAQPKIEEPIKLTAEDRDKQLEPYRAKIPYAFMKQQQFPHCNQYVLHTPTVCEFCDKYPDWQLERAQNKVSFTGVQVMLNDWMQCPADAIFNMTKNKWYGNQPFKESNNNGKP